MAKCIKLNPSDDDQAIKHELKKNLTSLAISLNQVIQTRGFVFLFIFYFYVYLLYLYLYFYIISMLNDVLYLCLFPLSTSTQHFLLIGLSAPADSLMLPLFAARTHKK